MENFKSVLDKIPQEILSKNKIKIVKNQYILFERLSEGQYGVVYKAIDSKTQNFVAIKQMKQAFENSGIFNSNLREISALNNLDNENIVKLLDQFFEDNRIFIVLEYVESDLRKLIINQIESKQYFIPIKLKSLMYQIIKGIYHIHSSSYIHRDLKPANILVTEQGQIKIADFGLSKTVNIRQTRMTPNWITLWYRPLEMLWEQQEYTQAVDIWSIGCIFAELCNLEPLFYKNSNMQMINEIINVIGYPFDWEEFNNSSINKETLIRQPMQPISNISKNLCELGRDLLKKMLSVNPNTRITALECLSHPYFEDIQDKSLQEIQSEVEQKVAKVKEIVDILSMEAAQEDI